MIRRMQEERTDECQSWRGKRRKRYKEREAKRRKTNGRRREECAERVEERREEQERIDETKRQRERKESRGLVAAQTRSIRLLPPTSQSLPLPWRDAGHGAQPGPLACICTRYATRSFRFFFPTLSACLSISLSPRIRLPIFFSPLAMLLSRRSAILRGSSRSPFDRSTSSQWLPPALVVFIKISSDKSERFNLRHISCYIIRRCVIIFAREREMCNWQCS